MKKLLFVGLAILLLMPVVASAQNAFDGTWKIDLSKAEFPKALAEMHSGKLAASSDRYRVNAFSPASRCARPSPSNRLHPGNSPRCLSVRLPDPAPR